jgi:hypothetical protein
MRQPAQPEHKPKQTQTTKTNRPRNLQEVVVLSNFSLLLTEKTETKPPTNTNPIKEET